MTTSNDLFDDIDDYMGDDEGPSKSQVKREMHELQALGKALSELTPRELAQIELPEKLQDAIELMQRITSNNAKRRQLQFIGRVMRDIDVEAIRHDLETIKNSARIAAQQHHVVEQWRDRILAEGDTAINAFLESYPDADRQKMRQLERQAAKESQQEKAPASARLLFKYLREVMA